MIYIDEILKNIDDFFTNTPKEVVDRINAMVAFVSFNDISYEDYLDKFTEQYKNLR